MLYCNSNDSYKEQKNSSDERTHGMKKGEMQKTPRVVYNTIASHRPMSSLAHDILKSVCMVFASPGELFNIPTEVGKA